MRLIMKVIIIDVIMEQLLFMPQFITVSFDSLYNKLNEPLSNGCN